MSQVPLMIYNELGGMSQEGLVTQGICCKRVLSLWYMGMSQIKVAT